MSDKNIFQRIIDREIPAKILYEDDQCLAFPDINPQAPTHVLVIPKKAIAAISDLAPGDEMLVGHMFQVIRDLADTLGLTDGYRVVSNCGQDAGQAVPHLHFHLLGGRAMNWPPG